jgi:hypothetical protein
MFVVACRLNDVVMQILSAGVILPTSVEAAK